MKITDKKVIGSIVMLAIVIGAGVAFLPRDVADAWDACQLENPDMQYCIYSVEREDKGITQIEVLTHNTLTESLDDFVRYKLSKNELTVYNGRFIGAKARWYVDYYKTYGEDEWVNLKRKVRKIDLEIEEFDTYVVLRKDTEYYATASLSGTGGHLIEEIMVGQKWHKYSVKWVPSEYRLDTLHRLRWKVDSFGLGVERPRQLSDEFMLLLARNVIVNWSDAELSVNKAVLTDKALEVQFIDKVGVYEIDPSIGVGYAANDWVQLISNTDICLYECEAILKITNPRQDLVVTDKADWGFEFIKKSAATFELKDIEYYIGEEKTRTEYEIITKEVDDEVPIAWDDKNVPTKYKTVKKTVIESNTPIQVDYIDWQETGLYGIYLEPGESYYLKVIGYKIPKLLENDIEWIPTIAGFKIDEWAWWTAGGNWGKKRVLEFVTGDEDINTNVMLKAQSIDVSGWGLTDLNEIRVINEDTDTSLDRNVMGTTSSTDLNVYFKTDEVLTKATKYDSKFYIYYGNISPGAAPILDSYAWGTGEPTSWDGFEDSDYTSTPKWIPTSDVNNSCATISDDGCTTAHMTRTGAEAFYFRLDFHNDQIFGIDLNMPEDFNWGPYYTVSTWFAGSNYNNSPMHLYIGPNQATPDYYMSLYIDDASDKSTVGCRTGQETVFTSVLTDQNTWHKAVMVINEQSGGGLWDITGYLFDNAGELIEEQTATGCDVDPESAYRVAVDTRDGSGGLDSNMFVDNLSFGGFLRTIVSPGAEETQTLDVNIGKVDGYHTNYALPVFKNIDENLTIDFNVFQSGNQRILVDINFSTTQTEGDGNVIIKDLNLVKSICGNDIDWDDSPSVCSWDWNVFNVPDDNYYVTIRADSGGLSDFNSANFSFKVQFVDSEDPVVTLFEPNQLDWVSGNVIFDINVSDNNGIDEAWLDSNVSADCFPGPIEFYEFWESGSLNDWYGYPEDFTDSEGYLHGQADGVWRGLFRATDINSNFADFNFHAKLSVADGTNWRLAFIADKPSHGEPDNGYVLSWTVGAVTSYIDVETHIGAASTLIIDTETDTLTPGQWYDVNVIRESDDNKIEVYIDDVLHAASDWPDVNFTTIEYITVRTTHGTSVKLDDLIFTTFAVKDVNLVEGDNNYVWNSEASGCASTFDINVTVYAKDLNAANVTTSISVELHVDNARSVTDHNALNTWYNLDTNVNFICTDAGGSCKNFFYSFADSNYQKAWGDLNIGVEISYDDNHEIWYWSSDQTDENEVAKQLFMALDQTQPTFAITSPADENQWYDSNVVTFDLNDNMSGVDIATVGVDINSVASTDFDWSIHCDLYNDGNWHCSYPESAFDTNGQDYNITVTGDDNASNIARAENTAKWVAWPSVKWGNVNDYYLSDSSGIDLYPGGLVDQNVIPVGQNDANGIFNVYNISPISAGVNVLLDLNQALPSDSNLVVCNQSSRISIHSSGPICWDINASKQAQIITNLALDANRMLWWFFDLNIIGQPGFELILDYEYEAEFYA